MNLAGYRYYVILFPVPAPTVNITSNPSVISAGSSVTLTCTVELSPSVDVPVIVNTVWTGPDGYLTANTAQPVAGSIILYRSAVVVMSFGRDQSGDYTCAATVSSSTILNSATSLSTITITVAVGKYSSKTS